MHSEETLTACHCDLNVFNVSALSAQVWVWRSLRVMWPSEDNRAAGTNIDRSWTDGDGWRRMDIWLTSVIAQQGQWQHRRTICVPWVWLTFIDSDLISNTGVNKNKCRPDSRVSGSCCCARCSLSNTCSCPYVTRFRCEKQLLFSLKLFMCLTLIIR